MSIPFILNIIGLCLNTAAALLIFLNSPKVTFQVHLYNKVEEDILKKKAQLKNNLSRLGALLLFIGFAVQLTAIILIA